MREIKFRAWFKDTGEMKEVAMNNVYKGNTSYLHLSPMPFSDYRAVDLMQYTGLKDKNGREIYLGDIAKREFEIWSRQWEGSLEGNDLAPYDEFVCAGYFIGVVSQTPQGLYVLNQCNKFDEDGNFIQKRSNIKLFSHRCEIIGNIYENPELLEGIE